MPNLQLQNNHRIQRNNQQIVGFDRFMNAVLLNRLQTEREEEDEVAQGAVPPVDCQVISFEKYYDNEPILVDEEEHEQDELLPYQLTNYYQQQCIHFEEHFNQWARNCKIEQLQQFEQQQQQQYKAALLMAEHVQQHLSNLHNEDDDDDRYIIIILIIIMTMMMEIIIILLLIMTMKMTTMDIMIMLLLIMMMMTMMTE
jgi:hypothetical protein